MDTYQPGQRVLITDPEVYCCTTHNPGDIDDWKVLPATVLRREVDEDEPLDGEAYTVVDDAGDESLLTAEYMKGVVA